MTTLGGPALWVELIQSDEGDRVIEIPANLITAFEFTDTDTGTDVAKLSLKNSDMRWYDEGAFRAGQKLNLVWGWESAMCTPRRMVVKKPSQGSNPITITLHDEGALLDIVPKKQHWAGMTDAQIASAIAEENGYTGILKDISETTAVREGTTQVGTDAAFLSTLARRNGFKWWVDGTGLHWGNRPTGAQPSEFFVYRNDFGTRILGQPEIEANLSKDVATVKVVAIDPLTRKEVFAEVGVDVGDDTLGDYLNNIISLGKEEEVSDPGDWKKAQRARNEIRNFMQSATTQTHDEFMTMLNGLGLTNTQKNKIDQYLSETMATKDMTLSKMMSVINGIIPVGSRASRISRVSEHNMGSATEEEVATEAERIYRETALNRYKMVVPVLGNPALGAKQLHHWTFPSETMSGLWYCKKAITSIAPGEYKISLHYIKDALGKLFLSKLHPVTRNKNELDEQGQPKDTTGLVQTVTWFEENGVPKEAKHWVDAKGNTVGLALALTSEEVAALSPADRASLSNASAGALPGK
jgi:phage protein D